MKNKKQVLVTITGAQGSGKSTLARLILRAIADYRQPPFKDEIKVCIVDEGDVRDRDAKESADILIMVGAN